MFSHCPPTRTIERTASDAVSRSTASLNGVIRGLIALCAMLALSSCAKDAAKNQSAEPKSSSSELVQLSAAQFAKAGIQSAKAQRRDMVSTIKVSGVIDVPPQNLISVSVAMGGYLASTRMLPGMHVSKGQEIAVMEDQSYVQLQQDYLIARSKFEQLKKDYERQKTLNQNKSSSDKTFEQVQAEYQSTQISVRALAEKLRLININPEKLSPDNLSRSIRIVSPINGYVSTVNVNIGAYVNASDVLFELVNPTDLHLALNVFEKDLPFIRIGQKVAAHLTADPAKTFEAEVILVGKKLNENRAATVHCHFRSTDQEMLPGMFVSADVLAPKSQVICIPEEAVVRLKDTEYIFIEVGDKQYRRQSIKRGLTNNAFVEVPDADEALLSQTIVVKNAWSLLMMMENTAD